MKQPVRMKHRISQIDGADDSEDESNLESKETDKTHISEGNSKQEKLNKAVRVDEVRLESNGNHAGQGTQQLSKFLEDPPAKVNHPEHGIGIFVEIDKDLGTFIYQLDSIKSEV